MANGNFPALTKAHRNAGIVSVLSQNYNGSYVCEVDLRRVDLQNSQANPRRHSAKHGRKISKSWFRRCVRNPILRYQLGVLTSIDGRHTSTELLDRKEFVITADVHFNISDAEAARIFHDLTVNSKRIDLWDAHTCALRAGMKHAKEIQATLDAYSLQGKVMGRSRSQCDVASYSPLNEAWEAADGRLDKICFLLSELYRNPNGRINELANDCEFMRGLIDLCGHENYVTWSASALASCLADEDLYDLKRLADKRASDGCLDRPTRREWLDAFLHVMQLSGGRKVA